MTRIVAEQIASLLNTQNQLAVPYTAEKILEHKDRYLFHLGADSSVVGAVEVKRVQWYQCEIDHLSVDPSAKRQGIGTKLVKAAEDRAKQLGARIAQCTIRVGNLQSEGLFRKNGYVTTATFFNSGTGNRVAVYQKVLSQ